MAMGLGFFLPAAAAGSPVCIEEMGCAQVAQLNFNFNPFQPAPNPFQPPPNPFQPNGSSPIPNPLDPIGAAREAEKQVRKAASDLGIPVPPEGVSPLKTPDLSQPWNPLGLPNFPNPAEASVMIAKESLKATVQSIDQLAKTVQDIDRARKKAEEDINRNVGKGLDDTVAELGRAGKNIGDAVQAIIKFSEMETKGAIKYHENAARRVREGKVVDAIWHMATEPLQGTENNAGNAAMESSLLATVGSVAASAYGGPAGAAAYAAWLTYRQTGDVNLALKVGVIAYVSASAMGDVKKMPINTASEVTKKAAVTAAIGGLAVAASGGDEQAVKDGFVRAGAMVLIQDGYKSLTGGDLEKNARASRDEPYCISPEQSNCVAPPRDAIVRGPDGKDTIDMKKLTALQQQRPHVGTQVLNGEAQSWSQETSTFMKTVSKIPGMNAMAVMHDQWGVEVELGSFTQVSILPAVVITYYGTSAPYLESIRSAAVKSESASAGGFAVSPGIAGVAQQTARLPELVVDETKKEPIIPQNLESSFLCAKDSDVRSIVVEIPTRKQSFACRIVYETRDKRTVEWQALNDPNYCSPHASELPRILSRFGYACARGDATAQTLRLTPANLSKGDGVRVPRAGDATATYGSVLLDSYEGPNLLAPAAKRRSAEWNIPVIRPGKYMVGLSYASVDARPLRLLVNGKLMASQMAGKVTPGVKPEDFQFAEIGPVRIDDRAGVIRLETMTDGSSWPHVREMRLTGVNP
jgi:hypothetical protein